MEWSEAYRKLRDVKFQGASINNESTIKSIKSLNKWHRDMFMEYFESFVQKGNIKSFKSYRYAILHFLTKPSINAKQFSMITQEDLDDILEEFMTEITTKFQNNQSALKNYFKFYESELSFTPTYIKISKTEVSLKNPLNPISCKDLEEIRYLIKDEPYLQFIFELAYENKVRFEDAKVYNQSNYNSIKSEFIINNQPIILSEKLNKLVKQIMNTKTFNRVYKYEFPKVTLYKKLEINGYKRPIKSSDVNEALARTTSFRCPECGNIYEATSNNWIVKQYYEDGELWIVCKEVCGDKHENL